MNLPSRTRESAGVQAHRRQRRFKKRNANQIGANETHIFGQQRWAQEDEVVPAPDMPDPARSYEPFSRAVATTRIHRCYSIRTVRRRKAFAMTLTDERDIAAAAMTGDNRMPKTG